MSDFIPDTPENMLWLQRYGGFCRDCADEAGVCPRSGIGCGDAGTAFRFMLEAVNYGLKHGYLSTATSGESR